MLEIEQLAVAELGLTEDMITENAGRGIAEAPSLWLPTSRFLPLSSFSLETIAQGLGLLRQLVISATEGIVLRSVCLA
jgi:hypothetical protein